MNKRNVHWGIFLPLPCISKNYKCFWNHLIKVDWDFFCLVRISNLKIVFNNA